MPSPPRGKKLLHLANSVSTRFKPEMIPEEKKDANPSDSEWLGGNNTLRPGLGNSYVSCLVVDVVGLNDLC